MNEVREFTLEIAADTLDDLKERLLKTRWPETECVDDWSQGIPLAYVRELAEYWRTQYDWRAREAQINRFDHFITDIDGLDIHFIHQRSPHPEARPILITHGWPGSFVEFLKVIDGLTDPVTVGGRAEDAFHVICPSLPGYGFSGKPTAHGWGVAKIARAWNTLMLRLGYDRYFAQGGDWGSAVTRAIGMQNLGACAGIHVNMAAIAPPSSALKDPGPSDKAALAAAKHYQDWDSGYSKQQATRPQTLGYGLVDSPTAQLAWIVEKFQAWTDCDGHPENALNRDEMLDNVMLYWLPACGASSARLYWESFGKRIEGQQTVDIPSGYSLFPKEIVPAPKHWIEATFTNLVYFNELDKGGHFAAFEQPERFIDEVRKCFALMTL